MCKREALEGVIVTECLDWQKAGQRSPVHYRQRGVMVDEVEHDGATYYRMAVMQDAPRGEVPEVVLIGDCQKSDEALAATVYKSYWDNYPHSHAILRAFVGLCNFATGHSTNPDSDPYNLTHYITASAQGFQSAFSDGILTLD